MVKNLAHWGHSQTTGRGLLALAGRGSIAQIVLENDESYIAHPRSALAVEKESCANIAALAMSLPTQ